MRSPCGVAANCCFLFYFVILFWFQLCLYVIAIWVAALTRFSFVFASLSCTERGLFPCCPLSCRSDDGQISVFDSTYLLDLDLWSHFTCWSQPLRIDCRDSARSLYSSMHFKVCSECLLHAMPHMARNPTTFPMCEGKDCCWPRCSSIVAIPPSLSLFYEHDICVYVGFSCLASSFTIHCCFSQRDFPTLCLRFFRIGQWDSVEFDATLGYPGEGPRPPFPLRWSMSSMNVGSIKTSQLWRNTDNTIIAFKKLGSAVIINAHVHKRLLPQVSTCFMELFCLGSCGPTATSQPLMVAPPFWHLKPPPDLSLRPMTYPTNMIPLLRPPGCALAGRKSHPPCEFWFSPFMLILVLPPTRNCLTKMKPS